MRLLTLALRRTLPPWLAAGLGLLLVLAARGAPATLAPALESFGIDPGAELRALARQNTWSVLIAAAPLLFFLSARSLSPPERAWLRATPARRLPQALMRVLGTAAAALGATILAAAAAEAFTPGDAPAWSRDRVLAATALEPILAQRETRQTLEGVGEERLRLWVTVAPGSGPAVDVTLRARRGDAEARVERRVSGRCALELTAPAGKGALELRLQRSEGALLVLPPDALEVLVPAGSERRAALTLGAHVGLALVCGCALALALSGFVRPLLAAALAAALALLAAGSAGDVPGADLRTALDDLASGLVPHPPPLASGLVAALVVLLAASLEARAIAGTGNET